jgi:hypothetical protein
MNDDPGYLDKEFGTVVHTTRPKAAMRQIEAAIEHFDNGEYECAITLAAAAEGMIHATDHPHIFTLLKERRKDFDYNLVINWLKHDQTPEEMLLPEFEVAITIMRAISKFVAVYNTGTDTMRDFGRWVFETGHLPIPDNWQT